MWTVARRMSLAVAAVATALVIACGGGGGGDGGPTVDPTNPLVGTWLWASATETTTNRQQTSLTLRQFFGLTEAGEACETATNPALGRLALNADLTWEAVVVINGITVVMSRGTYTVTGNQITFTLTAEAALNAATCGITVGSASEALDPMTLQISGNNNTLTLTETFTAGGATKTRVSTWTRTTGGSGSSGDPPLAVQHPEYGTWRWNSATQKVDDGQATPVQIRQSLGLGKVGDACEQATTPTEGRLVTNSNGTWELQAILNGQEVVLQSGTYTLNGADLTLTVRKETSVNAATCGIETQDVNVTNDPIKLQISNGNNTLTLTETTMLVGSTTVDTTVWGRIQ